MTKPQPGPQQDKPSNVAPRERFEDPDASQEDIAILDAICDHWNDRPSAPEDAEKPPATS
jgi:hypothetical protein